MPLIKENEGTNNIFKIKKEKKMRKLKFDLISHVSSFYELCDQQILVSQLY